MPSFLPREALIAFILLWPLLGCDSKGPDITAESLVGCWKSRAAHTELDKEFIRIHRDGSYEHVMVLNTKEEISEAGIWSLEAVQSERYLVLEGFRMLFNRRGACEVRAACIVESEVVSGLSRGMFGGMQITINSDHGYIFSKGCGSIAQN